MGNNVRMIGREGDIIEANPTSVELFENQGYKKCVKPPEPKVEIPKTVELRKPVVTKPVAPKTTK